VDRCNGNPAKLRKLGRDRFFAVVRRELPRFGAQRVCHRVAGQFFAALTEPAAVWPLSGVGRWNGSDCSWATGARCWLAWPRSRPAWSPALTDSG
jgi:hypothetical protein